MEQRWAVCLPKDIRREAIRAESLIRILSPSAGLDHVSDLDRDFDSGFLSRFASAAGARRANPNAANDAKKDLRPDVECESTIIITTL